MPILSPREAAALVRRELKRARIGAYVEILREGGVRIEVQMPFEKGSKLDAEEAARFEREIVPKLRRPLRGWRYEEMVGVGMGSIEYGWELDTGGGDRARRE